MVDTIHHVALSVTDLDRSAAWYEDLFGVVPVLTEESPGRRGAVYRFPDSQLMLGLVQHGAGRAPRFDPTVIGLDHVAWTVDDLETMDGWARRLEALGVEHSGVVETAVGAILNFRDPDGIQLAFYWDADPDLD